MDRSAVDVFHHQERIALGADAAVEQTGDVGMIELRQDLPLRPESLREKLRAEMRAQNLQRDALLEMPVGAVREINGPHAAVPEFRFDAIVAQQRSTARGFGGGRKNLPLRFERIEHPREFVEQSLIVPAAPAQKCRAVFARHRGRGVKDGFQALPVIGGQRRQLGLRCHRGYYRPRRRAGNPLMTAPAKPPAANEASCGPSADRAPPWLRRCSAATPIRERYSPENSAAPPAALCADPRSPDHPARD